MKPVLVLQHLTGDGPAYLAHWLQAGNVPFELRNTQAGDDFPDTIEPYAALAVLGGEMSANDDLPSLRAAEALIRQAIERDRPVIGHCLGGQLMARALGAPIGPSPAPEIGWQPLAVAETDLATAWFGRSGEFRLFQWHFDSFALPPGAVLLAGSAACPNQAFALGPHLAMQFHVELDMGKLLRWAAEDGERWKAAQRSHAASVQDGPTMCEQAAHWLPLQQALAARLYRRWWAGVSSPS
jgi:GMP synthase (glutamine-hydrolysing)